MKVITTEFPGLLIIEPDVFKDARGYFFESYNLQKFENSGVNMKFVQDNQSKSSQGVIRGLHYQKAPYAQTKLIRALQGTILDVVVDIRKGSPTYGKSFSIQLSDENFKQLLVPKGFAHGFSVLSETAIVLYKCDELYNKQAESGIHYGDPFLDIDWGIPSDKAIISEKDTLLPNLKNADNNFEF